MTTGRCFFILTTARSGSTSLARILDEAGNGTCAVEPMPNLNTETRLAMDHRLTDLDGVVRDVLVPRVQSALATPGVDVYGEKNLTYGPFVPAMERQFGDRARYVVMRRDGRDVVRSLIDWHDRMFGDIYRECSETGQVTSRALAAAAQLPVHLDTSDFSRPRPPAGTDAHDAWESMSRAEMCAWYWATINDLYADRLAEIPESRSVAIDYTTPTVDEVLGVADLVGLTGLTRDGVATMLGARINSLGDRIGEDDTFPRWVSWNGGHRRRFERWAGPCMQRCGYMTNRSTRWHPNDRIGQPVVETPAAASAIVEAWAQEHDGGDISRVELADMDAALTGDLPRAETVTTTEAIDWSHDIEVTLDALVDIAPGGRLCAIAARGWHPELDDHEYRWDAELGAHRTRVAPARVREHLQQRGCSDVSVEPVQAETRRMTRIAARLPQERVGRRTGDPQ